MGAGCCATSQVSPPCSWRRTARAGLPLKAPGGLGARRYRRVRRSWYLLRDSTPKAPSLTRGTCSGLMLLARLLGVEPGTPVAPEDVLRAAVTGYEPEAPPHAGFLVFLNKADTHEPAPALVEACARAGLEVWCGSVGSAAGAPTNGRRKLFRLGVGRREALRADSGRRTGHQDGRAKSDGSAGRRHRRRARGLGRPQSRRTARDRCGGRIRLRGCHRRRRAGRGRGTRPGRHRRAGADHGGAQPDPRKGHVIHAADGARSCSAAGGSHYAAGRPAAGAPGDSPAHPGGLQRVAARGGRGFGRGGCFSRPSSRPLTPLAAPASGRASRRPRSPAALAAHVSSVISVEGAPEEAVDVDRPEDLERVRRMVASSGDSEDDEDPSA